MDHKPTVWTELHDLHAAITSAVREEAMARSKGWAVADDWVTMIDLLKTRLINLREECDGVYRPENTHL